MSKPSTSTSNAIDAPAVLGRLVLGHPLNEAQADGLFENLLTGVLDEAQIGAALALLQGRTLARGASVDELVGAARAMRRHVTTVPVSPGPGEVLLDTCGTGGAAKTFNISTTTAIVAAAAEPDPATGVSRVLVAKHGNRSRTGRGSAEVFSALGVNIEAGPEVQARCLAEAGVCFSFAMRHHPAMRHAAGPRRSLGFPTIFNLLGPLTNPAGARRQLLGVFHPDLVQPLAEALARLGAERALVVHGGGGLDEASTLGPNVMGWVDGGTARMEELDPRSLGFAPPGLKALQAEDLEHGAELVRAVLAGQPGPTTDIVVLNAGLALVVAGASGSVADGIARARRAIESGRASGALDRLIAVSTT